VATNVPALAIGPTGVVTPDAAQVLAGAWADLAAAFGGDLNTTNLATPEGQLASSLTAIITAKNDAIRSYVAGVDPATSAGRMQDGIARIYFITRDPARPTSVQGLCNGLPGVLIPAGTQARAGDGNIYVATVSGSIAGDGTLTLPFACIATGPIPCPANTLSLYQTIPGWDSVTNPAAGVLGNDVETRAQFEARRAASVALNAQGSLLSVKANVLSVPNVLDAFVTENNDDAPLLIGGIILPPHSLYVAVSGGDPTAIIRAIHTRKPPGCNTFGNTSQTIYDTSYSQPYPSYVRSYQQAAATPVLFGVSLANGPDVPSDVATQVQAAIIRAFAGADGGLRARIGGTIYASRYYGAVASLGPWVRIIAVTVGQQGTAGGTATTLRIDQAPVVSAGTITVTLA
jgi:uncharacterized phage protein gp47/JayE